jgi:hypothetical protein
MVRETYENYEAAKKKNPRAIWHFGKHEKTARFECGERKWESILDKAVSDRVK